MERPYKKSWPKRGYTDKHGVWHSPTIAHRRKELNRSPVNPPPPPPVSPPTGAPAPSSASPPQPSKKRAIAITVAMAAAVGAVTLTASLTASGKSGSSLNVQVKADLTQSVAALAKLGFNGRASTTSNTSGDATACTKSATKEVQKFLMRHPCKEFATVTLTAVKDRASTQVVISWVVMPTTALANLYKQLADQLGEGNPPGQSAAFTGLCYASAQDGITVWAEQVKPTGDRIIDRQILQKTAPSPLSGNYVQKHCRR